MSQTIPFISQLSTQDSDAWLLALRHVMPKHQFKTFGQLTSAERQSSPVAITANPAPSQLEQLPNLEWIQSLWAGVDSLASSTIRPEVKIVRLKDPRLTQTMSEAALACVFYLHRDMPSYQAQQQFSRWQQHAVKLASERQVGILGMGELGSNVAETLSGIGFKVSGWGRTAANNALSTSIDYLHGVQGLNTLLSMSEILIVLLPLTTQTQNLLNHDTLALLQPNSSIINFSRGPIIDDQALIHHLDNGAIDHAILDVFDTEPLPKEHAYWSHPKVTVWPHIAAPTSIESATKIIASHINTYFSTGSIPQAISRLQQY